MKYFPLIFENALHRAHILFYPLYVQIRGGLCDDTVHSPLPYRVIIFVILLLIFDRPNWFHTFLRETELSEGEDCKCFAKITVTGTTWIGNNGDNRGLSEGDENHKISQNYQ
jgi:hypothetical protein